MNWRYIIKKILYALIFYHYKELENGFSLTGHGKYYEETKEGYVIDDGRKGLVVSYRPTTPEPIDD